MENLTKTNSTTFIECDVVMLPKSERDYHGKHITLLNLVEQKLEYGESNNDFHNADWAIQQNLYILSNETPVKDDWIYRGSMIHLYGGKKISKDWKKIIATTNKELKLPIPESLDMYPMSYSPKSLPNVSDEFVQKYIYQYNKGNEVKKVLVEFENAQSCSLYPEKCCGNPLDCTSEGDAVTIHDLKVSSDNKITTKLFEEKLPKEYIEKGLEILKEELEKSGIRKYTCVNGFGYSQLERTIVERILSLKK